jgi:hypothetical protein
MWSTLFGQAAAQEPQNKGFMNDLSPRQEFVLKELRAWVVQTNLDPDG